MRALAPAATLLVAAIVACSSYGSDDEPSPAPPNDAGTSGDAPTDGNDDAVQADAREDAGARCAMRSTCPGTALVETTFDDASWMAQWTRNGTVTLDTTMPVSSPNAVEMILNAGQQGFLSRTVSFDATLATCIEVCAWFDFDQTLYGPDASTDYASLLKADTRVPGMYVTSFELGTEARGIYLYSGDATAGDQTWIPPPGSVPHRKWAHLRMEVHWGTGARMDLWVDGQGMGTHVGNPAVTTASSMTISLGASTKGSSPPVEAHYDDLRVTVH